MENKDDKIKLSSFIVICRCPEGCLDCFSLLYGVEQFSFAGQLHLQKGPVPLRSAPSVQSKRRGPRHNGHSRVYINGSKTVELGEQLAAV